MSADPPRDASPEKYEVEVITTGPSSKPVEAAGDAVLRSVVERAFAQLGIDTPTSEFTFKSEDGTALTLDTKVESACPTTSCRITAVPTKKQDA